MRIIGLSRSVGIALAVLIGSFAMDVRAQAVGVPDCDEFLAKYSACIGAKVPPEHKDRMTSAIGQIRSNWAQVAQTPEGKAQLAAVCKQTADQLKQQVAALQCTW